MTRSIRIDKVAMASFFGAFINYDTETGSIVVEAVSLANGAARDIAVTIPYSRGGTVADIYASTPDFKTLLTGGGRATASAIYDFVSTETAVFVIAYSSTSVTVTLTITNNTGGAIVPIAQTIEISVVQYDAPITSI